MADDLERFDRRRSEHYSAQWMVAVPPAVTEQPRSESQQRSLTVTAAIRAVRAVRARRTVTTAALFAPPVRAAVWR
jgi:hypothetical protein